MVNVLPEPVTPSRVWRAFPAVREASKVAMAVGWSPIGW